MSIRRMYRRYLGLEAAGERIVRALRERPMNGADLAEKLDVSRPTLMRLLGELRRRGYQIVSIRTARGWVYENPKVKRTLSPDDPLVGIVGLVDSGDPQFSRKVDEVLYGKEAARAKK